MITGSIRSICDWLRTARHTRGQTREGEKERRKESASICFEIEITAEMGGTHI